MANWHETKTQPPTSRATLDLDRLAQDWERDRAEFKRSRSATIHESARPRNSRPEKDKRTSLKGVAAVLAAAGVTLVAIQKFDQATHNQEHMPWQQGNTPAHIKSH